MPTPVSITDLSTTAASNYPQGTDSPSTLDDVQRAHGAFIRQLQTGAVATTANVTAGTINGATVGANTPSTGAFTTLSATGTVTGTAVPFAFIASGASGANHLFQATNGTQDVRLGIDGSNNCYTGTVSAHDYIVQTGGSTRGVFSSIGLAVTGAVSATGKISNTAGGAEFAAASTSAVLKLSRTTTSAGDGWIGADATYAFRTYNSALTSSALLVTQDAPSNSVVVNSAGVGVGVTPSAWDAIIKPLEFFGSAYVGGQTSGVPSVYVGANAHYSGGGWKYKTTNAATNYISSNGAHQWYTAPSGTAGNTITFTQAMTLDASGNWFLQGSSGSSALATYTRCTATDTIFSSTNASGSPKPFKWSVNAESSTAMTLDASGGWKQTSTAATFSAWTQNANATTPSGLFVEYTALSPNNTGSQFLYCRDGGATVRAEIRSNGGLANFSANNVNLSDERVKKDFAPAKSYYDNWQDIEFVTFLYKDQTDTELNLGVKAQQLESVFPELIDNSGFGEAPEGEDPYKAVYQTDFQYATAKALQEAIAKIEALTARIQTLEQSHA